MEQEKNQPEKKFSTGAISATVWKNVRAGKDGKVFESRTVNLQRRYTDKTGQWQSTSSLRLNDLPKAALVLEEAYKYLVLNGHTDDTMPQQTKEVSA
jgi:hypothetical protein